MEFLHKLAHKLNMNKGRPDSFYDKQGRLMMSFLCECGKRSNIFPIDNVVDEMLECKSYVKKGVVHDCVCGKCF